MCGNFEAGKLRITKNMTNKLIRKWLETNRSCRGPPMVRVFIMSEASAYVLLIERLAIT